MLPNYANVFPGLKDLPHNTVNGVNYGVPHGRGPNLLGYNTRTSSRPRPRRGTGSGKAAPRTRARSASTTRRSSSPMPRVHLMKTKPELGIKDPYQLNQAQFDAAIELLQGLSGQQAYVLGPRRRPGGVVHRGDVVIGTTWQYQVNLLAADEPADRGRPARRGLHRLVRHLDDGRRRPSTRTACYLWMDHMMSAEANAQATIWFGEAPTSQQACDAAEKIAPGHCDADARDGRGVLLEGPLLGDARRPTARTPTRRPRA